MSKGNYTRHQQGIIKRYYEHKDSQAALKLQELVSELYLCEDQKKQSRLWNKAQDLLIKAGANKPRVEKVCQDRSVEALSSLVAELTR